MPLKGFIMASSKALPISCGFKLLISNDICLYMHLVTRGEIGEYMQTDLYWKAKNHNGI